MDLSIDVFQLGFPLLIEYKLKDQGILFPPFLFFRIRMSLYVHQNTVNEKDEIILAVAGV